MPKSSRVTIDVDSYEPGWRMTALRAAYTLKREADEVEVRISSSGKGIHIIGWFDERLTDEQKHTIRATLSDDSTRMLLDELRGHYGHTTQVLWTSKSSSGSADEDFSTVEDALDHIDMVHATDYERMRDYVNDGRKAYSKHRTFRA